MKNLASHIKSHMFSFSHLTLAHRIWSSFLKKGDHVIDATCGNGHDSLALSKMILEETSGTLFCIDIQQNALKNTQAMLQKHLPSSLLKRVVFFHGSHESFSQEMTFSSPQLIVYNLGYLPRGNKQITTLKKTTLTSLEKAVQIIDKKGFISITCYPGHPAGKLETDAVQKWAESLNNSLFSVSHHRWIHKPLSPSLLLIQKQ